MDAVDIPQVMKTLFSYAEGIPQFINTMKAAQRKSKHAKLVINDEYLHAVVLKYLLQYGEYETETREWSKLPEDEQTWAEWKTTFRAVYVAKRQAEAAREGEEKPFGGLALFGAAPVAQEKKKTEGKPQLSNQMLDSKRGTWTTSRQRRLKRRLMEARWRNWQLVWRYPLIQSPDSSWRLRD